MKEKDYLSYAAASLRSFKETVKKVQATMGFEPTTFANTSALGKILL